MSDANASDEWDVVVPEDGQALMEELRRHGVKPGQVVHMRSAATGRYVSRAANSGVSTNKPRTSRTIGRPATDGAPAFFKSIRSGEEHLGRRSKEILRTEFPAPGE
jgi:hypothetical protein